MNISERIKELREKERLSQQELADVIGVTNSYLSKVEKGECDISRETSKNSNNILTFPLQPPSSGQSIVGQLRVEISI